MPDYRVLPAGDTAIVVEFGETIDRRVSAAVLRALAAAHLPVISDQTANYIQFGVFQDSPFFLSRTADDHLQGALVLRR